MKTDGSTEHNSIKSSTVVQTGTDNDGIRFTNRSYNRVKPEAPDADAYDVANVLPA